MDFLKMKKQETYFAFRYEKMPKNFMDQLAFCNMLNIFKVLKILVSTV